MIDISKFDKADVLRVLYNAAQPQGIGMLQYQPGDMSIEDYGTRLVVDDE